MRTDLDIFRSRGSLPQPAGCWHWSDPAQKSPKISLWNTSFSISPQISLKTAAVAYFGASLWGGGAVLYEGQQATAWFEVHWRDHDLRPLKLEPGDPRCQTSFEYLTLFLVLLSWGAAARTHGLAILGDNIAALQCAISLRGRGALNDLSREIAWRRVRFAWHYAVGHVPSEDNLLADALSRTAAPAGSEQRDRPDGLESLPRVVPDLTPDLWETLLV